ncbi:hypothetical protein A9Q99_10685 [Gammaproteobacteria bacterium 45_16_T64]|nr:hypothetical protein A9Q99_10685 [Gammaproteobacteria bacterium 45_16_T64]
MNKFAGKTALITGASSGIGESITHQLAKAGANLILVARREDKLQILKDTLEPEFGITVTVISHDLAVDGSGQALYEKTKALHLHVDILINNAGYAKHGPFHDTPLETHLHMMHLLTTTFTELTYLYTADMKQKGSGYVLLVASIAGFMPIPQFSTYAASKAFVLSLGESLNKELSAFGINVTTLCPGGTATEFMDISGQEISGMRRHAIMTSDAVAKSGLRAMAKGNAVNVPGILYKLSMAGLRVVPRNLQALIGEAATK